MRRRCARENLMTVADAARGECTRLAIETRRPRAARGAAYRGATLFALARSWAFQADRGDA